MNDHPGHDRTGELIDPEAHPANCSGWEGDPDADNPKPCLICRPHLAPEARRRKMFGPPREDDQ